MFVTSLATRRDERGGTIVEGCASKTLSTNHVLKEETKSGMKGTTIPLTRETDALSLKLAERLDIIGHVI